MERFRVQALDDSTHVTVRIVGEAGLASAQALTQAFSAALTTERPIVVDCKGITFIDSVGASVLAEASALAEKCHVGFTLASVPEALLPALEPSEPAVAHMASDDSRTAGRVQHFERRFSDRHPHGWQADHHAAA